MQGAIEDDTLKESEQESLPKLKERQQTMKFSISTSTTGFPEIHVPGEYVYAEDDEPSPSHSHCPNKIMRKQRTLNRDSSNQHYNIEGKHFSKSISN